MSAGWGRPSVPRKPGAPNRPIAAHELSVIKKRDHQANFFLGGAYPLRLAAVNRELADRGDG
ncbi:hypothetical protein ACU19_03735 [Actinobaculum suis]|nr:hypothetical protein ACU19_03735 [Actinobaculum suis]